MAGIEVLDDRQIHKFVRRGDEICWGRDPYMIHKQIAKEMGVGDGTNVRTDLFDFGKMQMRDGNLSVWSNSYGYKWPTGEIGPDIRDRTVEILQEILPDIKIRTSRY